MAGCTVRTVSSYETQKTPMSDGVIFRLAQVATQHAHSDLAQLLLRGRPVTDTVLIGEVRIWLNAVQAYEECLHEQADRIRAAREKLERRLPAERVK